MDNIMKIIKSVEESWFIEKKVLAKQSQMKQNNKEVDFAACC